MPLRLRFFRPALVGVVAAGAMVVSSAGFEEARRSITAAEIRAHLFLLSSDQLAGRAPGTPGAAIAAEYIAARFIAAGLEPVDGTYFQDVPVRISTLDPTTISVAFESADERLAAAYPSDAVVWPGVGAALQVSGELVFAGFGIDAPVWGWDDFKGRDLSGRILLILAGDPPAPPDEPALFDGRAMTYYGRWTYKLEEARRQGASGALIVHRSDGTGYGWDVVTSSWAGEHHALADEEGNVPLQGWVTDAFARRALDLAGLDFDELVVRAARRDFRPVATGITVRARVRSRSREIRVQNVAGFLPGKEASLRGQTVVFLAHYDHLGTGPSVDGDSIYNGAYDNASGVSVLLELADAFAHLDGPDRGVLFLATTEEEAGLLGARHYTRQPLRPLESTVAAINIDGANLWGETDDAVALGAELSTLGRVAAARAAELGMQLRSDPAPEKGAFFRSDHFPFARAGVPVLSVQHGLLFRGRSEGWGDSVLTSWERDHYHRPSDELDPDADLSGAVQQARWIFGIGYDLAHGPERPHWHDGSDYRAPTLRP